jgi:eukaryotic-like serine/threonine-protein kinase
MATGVPAAIDRYSLVRPIGKGGMAEVFLGRLQGIGGFERDVAVKVLLPEYSSEPEFVEMLLDEARIAGAINHPCVVQVIDVGQNDDRFYLVMEHVDGADLRALLRRAPHRTLPVNAALHIVAEVLRGLSAVHGAVDDGGLPRRIVHRDVSPANVMISRGGVVKLGDFGIAHASSRLTHTRNGAVKGKLKYMAPEQIEARPVDHRADLFAAGVMLCEILLGDVACEPRKMTPYGMAFAWSPRLGGCLPRDVAPIVERALAEDPARRFCDAREFRRQLVHALARRAPGYGAEELAQELASLDEGFLSEAPTITSGAIELQTDYGSETSPEIDQKVTEPHRVAVRPPPLPMPLPMAEPFTAPSVKIDLRSPMFTRRTAVITVGAAGAAALAVAALLLGGASSAATPVATSLVMHDAPAPRVLALPARVATGTLSVEAPPDAALVIGSTVYAPGRLELPPGEYQVLLKRHARSRGYFRRVTIAAGEVTAIKL